MKTKRTKTNKIAVFFGEVVSFVQLISKGNHKVLPTILAGGACGAAVTYLNLFFSARILNQLIAGSYQDGLLSVGLLLGSQFAAGLVEKACDQVVEGLCESCTQNVKQRMAGKGFSLEYEQFEKQETMDALRRANNSTVGFGGIDMQVRVLYWLTQHFFGVLYALQFIIVLFLQVDGSNRNFFTSYASTIVLLLLYVVLIWGNLQIAKGMQRVQENCSWANDKNNSMMGYFFNMILDEKNGKDIRINGLRAQFMEKYKGLCKKCTGIYMETGKKEGLLMSVVGMDTQIAAGLSYLFVGAKAFYGIIGIGDVLLYAGSINRAMEHIVELMNNISNFSYRASILKTFEEFINRPDLSYDGTLPIEKRDDGEYEFAFHDVSFYYPGTTQEILSHVTLTFQIGEKLALVGRNGAGKTTLIKLLCRLYEPTDGYITLNGIDIRKYNYQEYTRAFSVVFQDFQIFSLPVLENIAAGEVAEEGRAWQALEQVGLKERVEKLPEGIFTQLYNNNGTGVDISGGEAQRLAIARALYKDSPFVILDEPTAALDPIAEAQIYENFNELVGRRSAIYISHRMSSCRFCDRIMVLEQGRIAESGTHEQLLKQKGIYAELFGIQAKYYVTGR